MKVYVISLERSLERRAHMTQQLKSIAVDFEFFDAVDASMSDFYLSDRAAPDVTFKRKGYKLIPAEIGCFASHFSLWEKCVEINEPIVILEDGADLTSDFKFITEKVMASIDKFEFVKLSKPYKDRTFIIKGKVHPSYNVVLYKGNTCSTTGYVISPTAAQKFINASNQIIEPVDDFMEKPWLHNVYAYSIRPFICNRAEVKSTIGKTRKLKSKIGFYSKLYIELYRMYESLLKYAFNFKK